MYLGCVFEKSCLFSSIHFFLSYCTFSTRRRICVLVSQYETLTNGSNTVSDLIFSFNFNVPLTFTLICPVNYFETFYIMIIQFY